MSSAKSNSNQSPAEAQEITRRKFIHALAIGITAVTGVTVFGEPVLGGPSVQIPQESTLDLYKACIDISADSIEMVVAAMKLRDGTGTAEEARAALARLKAAVDAIVI